MRPLIVLALLSGCAPPAPDVDLRTFPSCEALRSHMAHMARDEVSWLWNSPFYIGFGRSEFNLAGGFEPPGEPGAASYSTTNLQEQGVDEADLVKTDGTHLFALAGDSLVIARAWPLDAAEQLSATPIDGAPTGLYLVDDTAIVLSQLGWQQPAARSGVAAEGWQSAPSALVTVLDVSDPAAPIVLREVYTSGELKDSRRIDSRLFLVTYEDVDVTDGARNRREARANVHRTRPEEWLPRRFDSVRDGEGWASTTAPACDCTDIWAAELESGTFLTTIQSLDLTDPLSELVGTAVVGRGDVVYASTRSLYLAHSGQRDGPFGFDGELSTVVHKLALDGDRPAYRGSGRVLGVLPDQFGLSERDGVLRVATTDRSTLTSGVTTLVEGPDQRLVELGHVGGLAPGEELTAARFAGDVGYLVTFEVQRGDPLFTIDLSDPAAPFAGGELHVSGWSDYLHPIDAGHLLAVGMDQQGSSDWKLAVSLFDVTDLANPALADRVLLDAWGSEAQGEHHAFTWLPPTLAIPSWADSGQTVLEILRADTETVEPVGRVEQPASFLAGADAWCGGVRRSVIMEDRVWAVSSAGMTAAAVADPEAVQAKVRFQGIDPCGGRDTR